MLIPLLILAYLFYLAAKDHQNTKSGKRNPINPMETLQLRYINGEIDEETFTRLAELCK
ncbi:MAG: hypothetical protein LLG09_01910 [Negativicutes bacterium]|nr:hypothetical protein [Negativicutes bacterium]